MRRRTMSLATWCLLVLALNLYTASFFLPAFRLGAPRGAGQGQTTGGVPGYLVFRSALSRRFPSWLANVGFASGVLLMAARKPRASAVAAALGLSLALSAIPVRPVDGHLGRLAPGYWVWAIANVILLWACYTDQRAQKRGTVTIEGSGPLTAVTNSSLGRSPNRPGTIDPQPARGPESGHDEYRPPGIHADVRSVQFFCPVPI